MNTQPEEKKSRLTITAAIIVAAGLAAGVALARPAIGWPDPAGADLQAANQGEAPVSAYGSAEGYGSPAAVDTPVAETPATATPTAITIQNFEFGAPVTVAPDSTLAVTNADTAPHTLTFTDGTVDTGTVEPGSTVVVQAPSTPGTYTFFCAIHPSMTGQLIVAG